MTIEIGIWCVRVFKKIMVVLLVIFLVLKLIECVTGIDDCTRRVKEDEHGNSSVC